MLLTFEPFLEMWGKMTESPPFPIKGPCQQSCATPERSGVLSETEERPSQFPGLVLVSRSFMTSVVLRGSDQEFLASREGEACLCSSETPSPQDSQGQGPG